MMPAVEHGAGQHEAERPEAPVQVGVHQGGREEIERHDDQERRRRAAEQQGHHPGHGLVEDEVHRMDAPGGRPVQLLGAVVDGVEGPQPAGVEGAVQPVLDDIHQHDHDPGLDQHRQARDRAAAGLDGVEQPLAVRAIEPVEHKPADEEGQVAVEHERQQPPQDIHAHVAAEPLALAGITGGALAQQAQHEEGGGGEKDGKDHGAPGAEGPRDGVDPEPSPRALSRR